MAGRSGVSVPGPLGEFVEGFLTELAGLGYSPRTCEAQLRLTRHLSRWLAAEGLAAGDLTGDVVERFVAARRKLYSNLRSPRALVPLLGYLRTVDVAPSEPAVVAVTATDVVLQRFAGYLSSERGLAPATVASYLSQVRPFLVAYPGDVGGWASLVPRQVTAFVTGRAVGQRPRSVQVGANALRALLRWMWFEGMVPSPLADAVGSVAAPTATAPPRALASVEVRKLLAAVPADGLARLRDEAMLVLMLRLAMRAGEVAALQLEDVDWRSGVVTLRAKRGRLDQVPLPVDVGKALAAYLREGRPVGTGHREAFLALDAPHRPLGSAAVSSVVSRRLARAGIGPPGAAHRLRHTAACGVLAADGGLVEAGQLLRHSSSAATAIYAKADRAALAVLARPWPAPSTTGADR